jgi:hypothetical protein
MGKPHPVELRQRVVDHVAEGNTHRSTAARFKVSVKFVNDMVKLMKTTGGLVPKAQGNGGGHGKLSSLKDGSPAGSRRSGTSRLPDWPPRSPRRTAWRCIAARSGVCCASLG